MAPSQLSTDSPVTTADLPISDAATSSHSDARACAQVPPQPSTSGAAPQELQPPTTSDQLTPRDHSAEPPHLYLPACGALCDIFWWARRAH
jgi:hypothetical protein